MKISFAVTAYNETSRDNCQWIRQCIDTALNTGWVDEIVIVDDCSRDFQSLYNRVGTIPKVKLFSNPTNLGVFANKVMAVSLCKNDWVLLCDSDNVMDRNYFERIKMLWAHEGFNENTLYGASFAKPDFDYRHLYGVNTMSGMRVAMKQTAFFCAINTGNQLLPRIRFMNLFGSYVGKRFDLCLPDYFGIGEDRRQDIKWRLIYDAADSFFINKKWLEDGGVVRFVDGLEYGHRRHKSSWDRAPIEKEIMTPIFALEILDKLEGRVRSYTFDRIEGGCYWFKTQHGHSAINLNTMEVKHHES